MSNERLKAAIAQAGMDAATLADQVGVDAKTIERWISGRVPHRRNRNSVAQALATTPSEIWPDHDPTPPQPEPDTEETGQELIAAYRAPGDRAAPDPRELLGRATQRIDLLGLSLSDLIDAATIARLVARAGERVEIRILLADPESVHVLAEHGERDPDARLDAPPAPVWEVERTLGYLQPLLEQPGAEARLFTATRPNAILRVDDEMLVALHLWGTTPNLEPILHLQRLHDRGLFDRFAHHLDLVWTNASQPAPVDRRLYPDPDADPGRYQADPPGSATRRPHAFGPTYEREVSSTPSTAPTSSRRHRR